MHHPIIGNEFFHVHAWFTLVAQIPPDLYTKVDKSQTHLTKIKLNQTKTRYFLTPRPGAAPGKATDNEQRTSMRREEFPQNVRLGRGLNANPRNSS